MTPRPLFRRDKPHPIVQPEERLTNDAADADPNLDLREMVGPVADHQRSFEPPSPSAGTLISYLQNLLEFLEGTPGVSDGQIAHINEVIGVIGSIPMLESEAAQYRVIKMQHLAALRALRNVQDLIVKQHMDTGTETYTNAALGQIEAVLNRKKP